ncbi:hypothetical protein PS692_004365 [Escherichia coli]|nr:hypothetical protein [Escherichia coli]
MTKGQKLRAYLTHAWPYLTYAWRCIDRLVLVLIAFPATAFFLVVAFAGGMSFDGVARQFYELSAATPVVATDPTMFRVKVCADPKPTAEAQKMPPMLQECSRWEQQTRSLDQIAERDGRALKVLYLLFLIGGIGTLIILGRFFPKWPEPPTAP